MASNRRSQFLPSRPTPLRQWSAMWSVALLLRSPPAKGFWPNLPFRLGHLQIPFRDISFIRRQIHDRLGELVRVAGGAWVCRSRRKSHLSGLHPRVRHAGPGHFALSDYAPVVAGGEVANLLTASTSLAVVIESRPKQLRRRILIARPDSNGLDRYDTAILWKLRHAVNMAPALGEC